MKKKFGFTLAEGSRRTGYYAINSGKTHKLTRSAGFTLAEVLITLGIIGVVAAITIPSMISNYQKKTWVAQLQKSYALLNQGFRRMLADDNVSELSGTETFQSIGGVTVSDMSGYGYRECNFYYDVDSNHCKEFYTNLRKYFKIADIGRLTTQDNHKTYKLNGYYWLTLTGDPVITLMDGTMLFKPAFYSQDPNNRTNNEMRGMVGYFYIDVNGLKKPNKLGRDIFRFYLGDNGIVYPVGSQATSEYSYGNKTSGYWRTTDKEDIACKEGKGYGDGCAARVLEEGKMDYEEGRGGNYGY